MATFTNVTENNVNLSLTIYMIGVISAGVFIPLFCFKLNRKYILLWSAIIFFIGNIIIGVSTNFGMLLFFRFLTGFAHGSVFAVGAVVAAALVPKNKQGSAVAICFTALFVATFTFVPLFTYTSAINLPALGTTTYATLPMYKQL